MRLLLPSLLLATVPALAQTSPVIDRSDLPAVSAATVDSLRLSVARPQLPATAPALTQRGANQNWDYTGLRPTAQRVERYVSVGSVAATAPIYSFSFGILGGVNQATVASPRALPLPAGAPIAISNSYQFFAATNTDFRSVGYGGTIGGFTVPVTYVSQAQQDVIYRLPLSFASPADSSNSLLTTPAALAGTGYFSQKRKRVNRPDAWGTLTTPFGTFQTVRVVTRLQDHDSISFNGLNQAIDLPITREYKWLAKQQRIPLLTITTQLLAGREVVTGVEYRDTYRRLSPLAARDAATDAGLTIAPNPSAVGSGLVLTLPAGSGPVTVSATDLLGRMLFRRSFAGSPDRLSLGADTFGTFRGVALLTVETGRGIATRRVVRE